MRRAPGRRRFQRLRPPRVLTPPPEQRPQSLRASIASLWEALAPMPHDEEQRQAPATQPAAPRHASRDALSSTCHTSASSGRRMTSHKSGRPMSALARRPEMSLVSAVRREASLQARHVDAPSARIDASTLYLLDKRGAPFSAAPSSRYSREWDSIFAPASQLAHLRVHDSSALGRRRVRDGGLSAAMSVPDLQPSSAKPVRVAH